MERIQIITTPEGGKMVCMSLAEYDRLRTHTDDDEDEQDIREAKAIMARVKSGKEPLIPMDVAEAIWAGTNPIRAWRDYRGLTSEKLAKKVGVARAYLTQIETGKREGSLATMRKIAKALGTTVDALVD